MAEMTVEKMAEQRTAYDDFGGIGGLDFYGNDCGKFDTYDDAVQAEIAWLNDYHATVLARLSPLVSGDALAWLQARTQPL